MRPADVDEIETGDPLRAAVENARRKATAVDGERVLGVDTVVALDGEIYGKPPDAAAARRTLLALSAATHEVISGLAVADAVGVRTASAVTHVTFRALTPRQIDWYVACEEWRERAGGYAIQGRGAALVREIRGDYLNVVGLPAATLLDLLGF